jgi:hypothetical protein
MVPLLSFTESSAYTVNTLDAEEIHLYCESSLCLEITSTFDATRKEE